MISQLNSSNWIKLYIQWELALIKELGYEVNSNNHHYTDFPKLLLDKNDKNITNLEIKKGLEFTKKLLIQNFILPNKLKFPLPRNILEKYYV